MTARLLSVVLFTLIRPVAMAQVMDLSAESDPMLQGTSSSRAMAKIAERLAELEPMETETLVESCRALVEAREAALEHDASEPGQADQAEYTQQRLMDTLTCGAAIRRVAQAGDRRHLQVIDELCPRLPMMSRGVKIGGLELGALLLLECHDARIQTEFGDMDVEAFLQAWREHIRWLQEDEANRYHDDPARIALSIAFRRLMHSPANHRPEVFDALMTMLMDPDPRVAHLAMSRFIVETRRADLAIPATLRFLLREDINADARQAATRGLRALGYEPVSGPAGLEAVPIDGRGEVIRP